MSDDPLLSSKLKIKRADSHIQELEATLFPGGDKVYDFVCDGYADTGKPIIKLVFRPIPDMAAILVGEVAYLLRSSLDVAAVSLAKHVNPDVNPKDIYFPFAHDISDWNGIEEDGSSCGQRKKRSPRQRMRKLSPAAQRVIDDLLPYRGGNDCLWGINALCNTDKHQRLVTIAGTNMVTNLSWGGAHAMEDPLGAMSAAELAGMMANAAIDQETTGSTGGFEDGFSFVCDLDPVPRTEDILAAMNKHTKLPITVCFSETEVFDGEPVTTTLHQLCTLTREIVDLLGATIE